MKVAVCGRVSAGNRLVMAVLGKLGVSECRTFHGFPGPHPESDDYLRSWKLSADAFLDWKPDAVIVPRRDEDCRQQSQSRHVHNYWLTPLQALDRDEWSPEAIEERMTAAIGDSGAPTLNVRYESLVKKPAEVIEMIAAFLHRPMPEADWSWIYDGNEKYGETVE